VEDVRAQGRALRPPAGVGSSAPEPPFRRPPPAEGAAIADRAVEAMKRAPDEAAARRALDNMLDALYGPKIDKGGSRGPGKNIP
jgi:hypothetical protein